MATSDWSVAINGTYNSIVTLQYGSLVLTVLKVTATDAIEIHFSDDDADTTTDLLIGGTKDLMAAAVVGDILHLMWGNAGDVYHARWDLVGGSIDKAAAIAFAGSVPSIEEFQGGAVLCHFVTAAGLQNSRFSVDGGDNWTSAKEIDVAGGVQAVDISVSPLADDKVSWITQDQVDLGGFVYAIGFDASFTHDPGGTADAVGTPTGTEDVIFGVRDSLTVADWYGLLRTKNATSWALRPHVTRDGSGNVILLFEGRNDEIEVVSSSGSVLATVTPQSAHTANSFLVCLSPDGTSLVWGPKQYQLGTSPTAPAEAYVNSGGLSVVGSTAMVVLAGNVGYQTSGVVFDLDDGETQTYPAVSFISSFQTHNRPLLVVRVDAATGATVDSVQHSTQAGSWFSRWDQEWEVNDAPYASGDPAIAPDELTYTMPFEYTCRGELIYSRGVWCQSTASPYTLPSFGPGVPYNYNGQSGGVGKLSIDHTRDWLISTDTTTTTQSIGPGCSPAIDDLGNIFCSFVNENASSSAVNFDRRITTALSSKINVPYDEPIVMSLAANGDVNWTQGITGVTALANNGPAVHSLCLNAAQDTLYGIVGQRTGTSGTDLIFDDGGPNETTILCNLTQGGPTAIGIIFSYNVADGALNWVKRVRSTLYTSSTNAGPLRMAYKSLALNAIEGTIRVGVAVDFTAGSGRYLSYGDTDFDGTGKEMEFLALSGDPRHQLFDVVINAADGAGIAINRILYGSSFETTRTFDLRAG